MSNELFKFTFIFKYLNIHIYARQSINSFEIFHTKFDRIF